MLKLSQEQSKNYQKLVRDGLKKSEMTPNNPPHRNNSAILNQFQVWLSQKWLKMGENGAIWQKAATISKIPFGAAMASAIRVEALAIMPLTL